MKTIAAVKPQGSPHLCSQQRFLSSGVSCWLYCRPGSWPASCFSSLVFALTWPFFALLFSELSSPGVQNPQLGMSFAACLFSSLVSPASGVLFVCDVLFKMKKVLVAGVSRTYKLGFMLDMSMLLYVLDMQLSVSGGQGYMDCEEGFVKITVVGMPIFCIFIGIANFWSK